MTTSTCPDQDLIRAYAAGKLADANLESVDNHIGECLECQAVLETLDESPDTLVDRLRSGQATDPFQNESECRHVTAEAAAIASLPAAEPRRRTRARAKSTRSDWATTRSLPD